MSKRFSVYTLGCKINQYETQAIKEAWQRSGLEFVEDFLVADVVIVNTCAVTDRAVQDVRKVVRRLVRVNPEVEIILTGCAVSIFKEELKKLPNVKQMVSQSEKSTLLDLCSQSIHDFRISNFPRARAVVKIQDGCSYFCSYCIVPYTRGKPRSRNPEDVLKEILTLARKGFKEVVLSGINLGQFVFKKGGFWEFLFWLEDKVCELFGEKVRFRLSSLDPGLLNEKALRFIEKSRLLCPHLHISVQSASERILKLMNRKNYTPLRIKKFVESLRGIWDIFGLSGDFLVGFPSESEEDFLKTYEFCRELPFTHGHVFSFSPRPKTLAYGMKAQVSWDKKKERNKMLRDLFSRKKREFVSLLCKQKRVLDIVVEDIDIMGGMSEYYVFCRFKERKKRLKWGDRIKGVSIKPFDDEVIVDFYEPS